MNIPANNLKIVGEPFASVDYNIAVCKDRPDLLDQINGGLAAVQGNGTLTKLTRKWLARLVPLRNNPHRHADVGDAEEAGGGSVAQHHAAERNRGADHVAPSLAPLTAS